MANYGRKKWIDMELTINGETIQLKQVKKIGGGWFLPIPKVWLDFSCKSKNSKFFVVVDDIKVGQIIIRGYKG